MTTDPGYPPPMGKFSDRFTGAAKARKHYLPQKDGKWVVIRKPNGLRYVPVMTRTQADEGNRLAQAEGTGENFVQVERKLALEVLVDLAKKTDAVIFFHSGMVIPFTAEGVRSLPEFFKMVVGEHGENPLEGMAPPEAPPPNHVLASMGIKEVMHQLGLSTHHLP